MRIFSFVIILIPFLFTGFSYSQQIYFNNRYNLCGTYEPDAWSSSSDILPIEDGYVLAGATVDTSTYWMRRIALMKLDLNGSIIMLRDFGNDTVDYYKGWPGSLIIKTENQFYLAGAKEYWNPERYAVGYLMSFDSLFDTIWTRSYNLNLDSNPDTNSNFAQMDICSDNDFIFGGSMNGDRMLLLRTDSLGNMRWYRTFHLDPNTLTTGYSVIQTSDGGFALGGFSYYIGNPESGDPIIIKTDSLGNQEWIKYLGGNFLDNRAMLSLAPDGTIVMGSTYGESMSGDDPISFINIAKINNEGAILWDKNYGLSFKYNYLFNVRALSSGDIIATGRRPDVFPHLAGWIIKVNNEGEELWYREYSHLFGPQSMNQLSHVIETSDNGYIACGYVNPFPPDTGNRDAWVIKLDSLGCDTAGCDTSVWIAEKGTWGQGDKESFIEVWPNPCSTVLSISYSSQQSAVNSQLDKCTIEIYDIFGRKVDDMDSPLSIMVGAGGGVTMDVSALPPGLYLVVVKDEGKIVESAKFIVVR